MNPNIKKEKWTTEEDELLTDLVSRLGNKARSGLLPSIGSIWDDCLIDPYLPAVGRDCPAHGRAHRPAVHGPVDPPPGPRHRQGELLRPDRAPLLASPLSGAHSGLLDTQDTWRPEEDRQLLDLYARLGSQWSRISKHLKGRTSQQCRQRFFQLGPDSATLAKAAEEQQQIAAAQSHRQPSSGPRGSGRGGGGYRSGAADLSESDEEFDKPYEVPKTTARLRAKIAAQQEAAEAAAAAAVKVDADQPPNGKRPLEDAALSAPRIKRARGPGRGRPGRPAAAGSKLGGPALGLAPLLPADLKGLFSPEPLGHDVDGTGLGASLLGTASKTPVGMPSAILQASQLTGGHPLSAGSEPPSGPWKLSPTAGLFSPQAIGFRLSTAELPSPLLNLFGGADVRPQGPDGMDQNASPLVPLVSPTALNNLMGGTPGDLLGSARLLGRTPMGVVPDSAALVVPGSLPPLDRALEQLHAGAERLPSNLHAAGAAEVLTAAAAVIAAAEEQGGRAAPRRARTAGARELSMGPGVEATPNPKALRTRLASSHESDDPWGTPAHASMRPVSRAAVEAAAAAGPKDGTLAPSAADNSSGRAATGGSPLAPGKENSGASTEPASAQVPPAPTKERQAAAPVVAVKASAQ